MVFIIILVAIVTVGRIVRQGIDLEAGKRGMRGNKGSDDVALLERENAMLRGKLDRLEERTAVLERIATDAPARLTAEIEKLRD
jgi:hypothetical protein